MHPQVYHFSQLEKNQKTPEEKVVLQAQRKQRRQWKNEKSKKQKQTESQGIFVPKDKKMCGLCDSMLEARDFYIHICNCKKKYELSQGIQELSFKIENDPSGSIPSNSLLQWPFTEGRNYMNSKKQEEKLERVESPFQISFGTTANHSSQIANVQTPQVSNSISFPFGTPAPHFTNSLPMVQLPPVSAPSISLLASQQPSISPQPPPLPSSDRLLPTPRPSQFPSMEQIPPPPPIPHSFDNNTTHVLFRPSKSLTCCVKMSTCVGTCRQKKAPIISINDKHFFFCDFGHFSSRMLLPIIENLLNNTWKLEQISTTPSRTFVCTKPSCKSYCNSSLAVHGNIEVLSSSPILYFCKVSCLLDYMAILKAGTWKKLVKKMEIDGK